MEKATHSCIFQTLPDFCLKFYKSGFSGGSDSEMIALGKYPQRYIQLAYHQSEYMILSISNVCVLSNPACSYLDTLSGSWKYSHKLGLPEEACLLPFEHEQTTSTLQMHLTKISNHTQTSILLEMQNLCELKSKQVLQINSSIWLIGTIWSFGHTVGAFSV